MGTSCVRQKGFTVMVSVHCVSMYYYVYNVFKPGEDMDVWVKQEFGCEADCMTSVERTGGH